jgi:chaperonin cofactor prefoldin
MSDIERTSLDAHVSLCELRYQTLERRIDQVESSLAELKDMIQEIHTQLLKQQSRTWTRWDKIQWSLIAALSGIVGWLVVSYILR